MDAGRGGVAAILWLCIYTEYTQAVDPLKEPFGMQTILIEEKVAGKIREAAIRAAELARQKRAALRVKPEDLTRRVNI